MAERHATKYLAVVLAYGSAFQTNLPELQRPHRHRVFALCETTRTVVLQGGRCDLAGRRRTTSTRGVFNLRTAASLSAVVDLCRSAWLGDRRFRSVAVHDPVVPERWDLQRWLLGGDW